MSDFIKFKNPLPNGGVPFFANDFNFMQDMQLNMFNIMLEQYYALLPSGNASLILSGLEVGFNSMLNIQTISAGFVMLNREIYWYNGGTITPGPTIYIKPSTAVDVESRPLENNSTGVVKIKNVAIAETTLVEPPAPYIKFNPLPTVYLKDLMFRATKRIGEIIPLSYRSSQSNTPLLGPNGLPWFLNTAAPLKDVGYGLYSYDGFAICNGGNGTPDLRGKFLTGYDVTKLGTPVVATNQELNYGQVGNTGGLPQVRLTESQSGLRTHTHPYLMGDYARSFQRPLRVNDTDRGGGSSAWSLDDVQDVNITHTHPLTIYNVPGADAINFHENRPPYSTVLYIQRTF